MILYNQQDCFALQKVREFLAALPADGETREAHEGGIRFVEQIKTDDDLPAFGKKRFAVEDFSPITKRAYFDYQRDKIYVRTNPHFKDLERRKQKNKKRYQPAAQSSRHSQGCPCPYCKGSNISRDYTNFHARDSLDLRISPGGIKRWIIRYRAPFHRCRDCDRTFVPQTWRNQRRFGHSLIAWSIDQHVTNRITFENLERTAKDYFGLPFHLAGSTNSSPMQRNIILLHMTRHTEKTSQWVHYPCRRNEDKSEKRQWVCLGSHQHGRSGVPV